MMYFEAHNYSLAWQTYYCIYSHISRKMYALKFTLKTGLTYLPSFLSQFIHQCNFPIHALAVSICVLNDIPAELLLLQSEVLTVGQVHSMIRGVLGIDHWMNSFYS